MAKKFPNTNIVLGNIKKTSETNQYIYESKKIIKLTLKILKMN